ncbi:MAG: InlB B-repeat-containing protein [Lachnospiraceae bacterium]|nr:InlB B-repeat-containing protein [Lachnospiraceae bacterium]
MKRRLVALTMALVLVMGLIFIENHYIDSYAKEEELSDEQIATSSDAEIVEDNFGTNEEEQDKISEAVDENEADNDNEDMDNFSVSYEQSQAVDDVKITVSAEEGVFPDGATLTVRKVSDDEEDEAIDAVDNARVEGKNVAASYIFDIKVLDADGNEIEPNIENGNVKVSFELVETDNVNLDADIYHIVDEEEGEALTAELLETYIEEDQDAASSVTAMTDGFSYYVVEFTYEERQYVLDGDSSIELAVILDAVGLTGEAESVSVSDDSLFNCEKNDEGVWMVNALSAFSSEEWMKVTLDDGITYEIVVTDDNDDWSYPTSAPTQPFAAGSGTEEDPYQISSAQELANLAYLVGNYSTASEYRSKFYILTKNINLGGTESEHQWTTPIGTSSDNFMGTFDGKGYTISGLYCEGLELAGLFGQIYNNTYIKNVEVKGVVIGTKIAGGLVGDIQGYGSNNNIYIENCINNCTVSVSGTGYSLSAGGIIGRVICTSPISISNCTNKGDVTGTGKVACGGICGLNTNGKPDSQIVNCDNEANIKSTEGNSGGICAEIQSGVINNCCNKGSVEGSNAGGIFAYGNGNESPKVEKSYNEGEIKGYNAGGIVGNHTYFDIYNCYNRGNVISSASNGRTGGISGVSYYSLIENCYNSGDITGVASNRQGGILGYDSGNNTINYTYCLAGSSNYLIGNTTDGVTNGYIFLSEDDFKDKNKFANFDFDKVWKMNDSVTYPVLIGVGEGLSTCTVTFDSKGGSGVASQTIPEGTKVSQPMAPTKVGYVFRGWYIDDESEPFDFSTAITSDITLTAKWLTIMTGVSCNNYAGAYDGAFHGIAVTAPNGATVKYGTEAGKYNLIVSPKYIDVGEDTVYYQVSKEGYATVTGSATITITQKEIEISWTNTSLTYNGSNQKPTATSSDIINDDDCSIVVSGEQKNANSGTTTYTATATLKGGSSSNYKIKDSDKTTTFTIGKKDIVISGIKAKNKTYDGNTAAELDYSEVVFGGIIGEDNLIVTATGTFSDANAGDGKIVNISNLALSGDSVGNYKLAEIGQQTTTTANISKAAIFASADDITATYADDTVQKISVNVTTPVNGTGCTITYKTGSGNYSAVNPEFSAVGTYTVDYKVSCANYNDFTGSATITINEASFGTGSITASGYSGVYDGSEHGIEVNVSGVSGAIIKYSETENGTYKTTPIKYKDVTGSAKTVYYKVEKTGYTTVTGSATVSITPKAVTVTPADNQKKTYGEADPASYTYTAEGLVSGESLSGRLSREDGTNAGEYAFTIGTLDSANSNYSVSLATGDIPKFVIEPKEIGITWGNTEFTYDKTAKCPTATVTAGSLVGDDTCDITVTGEKINAGDNYTATASITNQNYKLPAVHSTTFKIKPAIVKVSGITASNKNYDGTTAVTFDCSNASFTGKIDGDILTVSAMGTFDNKNVGNNKTVTISGLTLDGVSKDNYQLAEHGNQASTTASVTAREVEIAWGNTSFIYNGAEQRPTAEIVAATADKGVIFGEEVTVSVSGGQTNVSDNPYEATASLGGEDSSNYIITNDTKTQSFSIDKKALTIKAKDKTITYGDSPSNAGVTYTGFVNGETENVLRGELTYSYDYSQYDNVGDSYKLTPSGLTSDNYAITYEEGTLTVKPKVIGLEWGDTEFTYDGNSHCPTATATGVVNNDECTVTVTEGQTVVGDNYTATASITNTNYKLPTAYTTTFKINPAKITVSGIKADNKVYDGNTSATLDYANVSLEGKIAGDDLSVSATGTFVDYKPAADITVSITGLTLGGTSTGNYVLAAEGQQTTTKADITIDNDTVVETIINPGDNSTTVIETKYENGEVTGITETTTSEDGNAVTVVEKNASNEMMKTTVTVNNSDGTKTITETYADGSGKVTEEDSVGNITKETVTGVDGSKIVTENSYDNSGDKTGSVVTTTSADGKTVTVEEKDASDNTTKTTVTEKDASDNVVKTTVTLNNADGTKTITETNADGSGKVTEEDSSGNITIETETNADGSKEVTENSYDNAGDKTGSVVTTTSADGKTVTVVEKDASGDTTKTTETVTNADGTKTVTTTEGNTTTIETKDSEGNITKTVETVKNADESTTITEKDASGNITKETVINADGSSKVTEKDADGKVTKETLTDADGSKEVTENSYDNTGDKTGSVVTTTSSDGKTVTVEEKDASGDTTKTTETVTNADGTKTVTTTEGNTTTIETKDSEGNTIIIETVDNSGETTSVIKQEFNEQGTAVKAVEEIGDAPDTILNDDVDTLVDKLISDEEKARQQNGEIVKIILDVEDVTDTVAAGDKEKISSELATDEKVGEYFDINLYKQIGTSARVQITDTNNEKISISMRIPDELLNHDDKVERTYHIVRLHEGTAELIDSTTDLTKQLITFETDKFSIYAITYIDKALNTSTDNEQNDNSSDNANSDGIPNSSNDAKPDTPNSLTDKDNPSATPAEVKTPDTQADTGKTTTAAPNDNKGMSTGDKVNLAVVIMLMLDSAMAALYLSLRRRKM